MAIGGILLEVTGDLEPIDGKTVANTKIFDESDLPSGNHISPVFVTVETYAADSISLTAIFSVGTNSPNYDNILAAHAVKPVAGLAELVPLQNAQMIDSETDVYVRVQRAASGTELTFVVGMGRLQYTVQ